MVKNAKRPGKPKLSEAEREARKEKLAAETKGDKFVRLGMPRMKNALRGIGLIGNLAGAGYEYTPEQVAKMKGAITEAVDDVFERFNRTPKAERAGFSF